jgi:peptidoglycan/xylan/chitin deacetylase (PgdA/CDA1 family)
MYVSPQALAMHLELLGRYFTLIHLDDWLEAIAVRRPLPARACAITFDDGWRDNYEYAFPVLMRAQAPATIYLVSDLVGTRYSFWPNQLARILADMDAGARSRLPRWMRQSIQQAGAADGPLNARQIDRVIVECKNQRSDAQMLAALEQFGDAASGTERDLMSWDEIRQMWASGLIKFGSHTRWHTRLSRVSSPEALKDEVVGSRECIERQLGVTPRTFCYPNGDTSPEAVEWVRSTYAGAVTTASGWHSVNADPFMMRRICVHEAVSSRGALCARISGWI